ncbi:MAG: hypothetical protein SNJ75_13750 [Gemmataceae bacterium]
MIVVGFLLPLGVYLLVLGRVNQRYRPLAVSGVWDAITLLAGLSGFFLLAGPVVLTSLQERWRRLWIMGDRSVLESLDLYRPGWILAALGYFLAVVALAAWIVWRSRHLTVVYNLETEDINDLFLQACQRAGIVAEVVPGGFRLTGCGPSPSGHVRIERMDALKNVTLHWSAEALPLREPVEQALNGVLAEYQTPDHWAGLWITLAGLGVLTVALLVALVVVVRLSMGY